MKPFFAARTLATVVTYLTIAAYVAAQPPGDQAGERASAQPPAKVGDLPVTKVVMFSSGVGFFEHLGQVEGDAQVRLQFNVDDVNDLLKSMVVQDLGGGTVSTVNYESKEPITRTLRTFAIDLTDNPTLGQLLSQVRGERVQVDAPNAIVGVIVGVETREEKVGDKGETVQVEYLNLLTDDGLRRVGLASVTRIRLLNEQLDAELRKALAILAMSHATDKKTVSLHFRGEGKRPVRVGYIQETPIWKTSYRLVLRDKEQPLLQGWAIVENTTESDWNNVDLTLVSGRPISFTMDLYDPLYIKRPKVELELFSSLRPQVYGQDLVEKQQMFRQRAAREGFEEYSADAAGRAVAAAPSGPTAPSSLPPVMNARAKSAAAPFDISQGVQSLAQAGEVGQLFQYQIQNPVTLPRQQSAMLPIVQGQVKAEKVSIYNQNVQAKHPLNGLQLTNTTGLHLMQGPITVFDGGAYAGDAQIQDLEPGSRRLISYAVDLSTEVAPAGKPQTSDVTGIKLVKGVLHITRQLRRTQEYTIKNSGSEPKKVLIEYPKVTPWKLVEPEKPEETTRDLYRFAVTAKPGEPAVLTVREEQTVDEQVALTNINTGLIVVYMNNKAVSPAVKEALAEVVRRKQALSQLSEQRQRLESEIKTIDAEQARIRQNMAQLDRTSDLYARYVTKFVEQEDTIEKLRGQIRQLTDQESKARRELDQYLADLTLE